MSRCFRFPPPGYEKNGLSGEDLVEWIKRETEREESKREREKAKKERKRAKKREKDEKEKSRGRIGKGEHSNVKSHQSAISKVDQDNGTNPKRREAETEKLDKSDVTEEHEQPDNDQFAYESSDNTRNSKKRKLHNLFSDGSMCVDIVDNLKLHPLSHSGRIELAAQTKAVSVLRQEHLCSTSGISDIQYGENARSSFFQSSSKELELQIQEPIESWVPSQLQLEHTDSDDMEWLFETKQRDRNEVKRLQFSPDESCHRSSSLWPRACYLPTVDLYALPFTIPY